MEALLDDRPRGAARVRPRGVVTLVALGLVAAAAAAAGTSRLLGPHPAAASPVPPATVVWRTLPAAGQADTVVSIASDPQGTLWLAEAVPGGAGWQLFHATAAAASGGWPVAPVPSSAGGVVIQTVGGGTVWLAAGPQELSFDPTTATFHTYPSQPAASVASVGGDSVAVYLPEAADGSVSGAAYVLAAPLGGSAATRIALPGAPASGALPQAAVIAGPSGTALVTVGRQIWSVTPGAGTAQAWGSLPSGADAATAAWGDGRLWVEVPSASSPGAPPAVKGVSPTGTAAAVPAAQASPPALGGGLVFSAGHLWWAGSAAVLAWNPASGQLSRFDLPSGVTGPALLAPGPAGSVWAAAGNRFARLPPPR